MYDTNEDINQSLGRGLLTDEPSMEDLEAELSSILAGGQEVTQEMTHPPHQDLINAMCRMRVVDDEVPGTAEPGTEAYLPRPSALGEYTSTVFVFLCFYGADT